MWAVPAHALSSHDHAAVRGPGLCLGLPLSALVDLLRHTQGGPGLGPSRVKGGVGEYFRHLSGGDAVAFGVGNVKFQRTVQNAAGHQGRGIGSALMREMIDLCDNWLRVDRIELTVFADNEPAIAVYKKHGFEIEGTGKRYALRNGEYVDAYYMARMK